MRARIGNSCALSSAELISLQASLAFLRQSVQITLMIWRMILNCASRAARIALLISAFIGFGALSAHAQRANPLAGQGLEVSAYVNGLGEISALAFEPQTGDVFALDQSRGRVIRLRDRRGDGRLDLKSTYVSGFHQPSGLAVGAAYIYVADVKGVWQIALTKGLSQSTPARLLADLTKLPVSPAALRPLALSPDQTLVYVGLGTKQERAEVPAPLASIVKVDTRTGRASIHATGLRHVTALSMSSMGKLAANVDETLPASDMIVMPVADGFYGFPYAHGDQQPVDGLARQARYQVAKTIAPLVPFTPAQNSDRQIGSALLMPWDLSRLDAWPEVYAGQALVAFAGSRPRIESLDLAGLAFEDSVDAMPLVILDGFSSSRGQVYGQPTAMTVDGGGGLLVADSMSGTIWRLKPAAPILKNLPTVNGPLPTDLAQDKADPQDVATEEPVLESPRTFRRGGSVPRRSRSSESQE